MLMTSITDADDSVRNVNVDMYLDCSQQLITLNTTLNCKLDPVTAEDQN